MALHLQTFMQEFLSVVAICTMVLAALSDLASRLIPNPLPALLALCAIGMRVMNGQLIAGLIAAGAVFVLAACIWKRGWLGGGDVKLLAAASLLVAAPAVPGLLAAVALAGGALALIYLGLRVIVPAPEGQRPATRIRRILRAEQWRIHRRGPIPYATAIAAGTIFTLAAG